MNALRDRVLQAYAGGVAGNVSKAQARRSTAMIRRLSDIVFELAEAIAQNATLADQLAAFPTVLAGVSGDADESALAELVGRIAGARSCSAADATALLLRVRRFMVNLPGQA